MFEPEVFWKEIYCIEESAYKIVGTFWHPQQTFGTPTVIRHPHDDLAPREFCSPWSPIITPLG